MSEEDIFDGLDNNPAGYDKWYKSEYIRTKYILIKRFLKRFFEEFNYALFILNQIIITFSLLFLTYNIAHLINLNIVDVVETVRLGLQYYFNSQNILLTNIISLAFWMYVVLTSLGLIIYVLFYVVYSPENKVRQCIVLHVATMLLYLMFLNQGLFRQRYSSLVEFLNAFYNFFITPMLLYQIHLSIFVVDFMFILFILFLFKKTYINFPKFFGYPQKEPPILIYNKLRE